MFIDVVKHMLESDNRFITDGEEITDDELQNAKEYIFNFQDLLKVINKNYQNFIVKIVQSKHLVLNNKMVNKLANRYHTTPKLVDQLIRIKRIGHDQKHDLNWGDGNDSSPSAEQQQMRLLYETLFEKDFKLNSKLQKKMLNNDAVLYFDTEKNTLNQWNNGLVIQNDQIIFPITISSYSENIYHYFVKTGQVEFFNFEKIVAWNKTLEGFYVGGTILVSIMSLSFLAGDKYNNELLFNTFKISLILSVIYSVVLIIYFYLTYPRQDPSNGLLKNIDYQIEDPNMIVKKYRVEKEWIYNKHNNASVISYS